MKNRMAAKKGSALVKGLLVLLLFSVGLSSLSILAAIAVPNFMEAQTRKKVERVNSDEVQDQDVARPVVNIMMLPVGAIVLIGLGGAFVLVRSRLRAQEPVRERELELLRGLCGQLDKMERRVDNLEVILHEDDPPGKNPGYGGPERN